MDEISILIVEDNPERLALIEALFARGLAGAKIDVVLKGLGAKRYLSGSWPGYEDDADLHSQPTLIVLDLWRPDKTAFEMLEWMAEREWLSKIPVILFSASRDPEDVRRAYSLGVRRYLYKPDDYGNLIEAVKEELQRRTDSQEESAFA